MDLNAEVLSDLSVPGANRKNKVHEYTASDRWAAGDPSRELILPQHVPIVASSTTTPVYRMAKNNSRPYRIWILKRSLEILKRALGKSIWERQARRTETM